MILANTLLLCVGFFALSTSEKLPSNLMRCHRKDQICLKKAIQDAIPKFAEGIRSMNIPGIDPLLIPKMVIPGEGKAVKVTQTFIDCKLIGLSKLQLKDLDFDVDTGKINWNFHNPKLIFKGNYTMTGQVLVLPVNGKGQMQIDLENVRGEGVLNLVKFSKNNEQYFKIDKSSLKIDADHIVFNFKNLFEGNEQISKQINDVLNDNWREVFDELKDRYNAGYAVFTDNIANKFFSLVPLSEIFLD